MIHRAFILPLSFLLTSLPVFAQTFMIVASEVRNGEALTRPFASQEGMIEGMFDLGFVSFDTGPYAPAVDWGTLDFAEPLVIARQGLARYLLAAEVRSITEPRDPKTLPPDTGESPAQGLLKIETSVEYHLFDVRSKTSMGRGEAFFDNDSPETLELTYGEFLLSVGREIARRGVELMEQAEGKR
jgi:hypothetical protein